MNYRQIYARKRDNEKRIKAIRPNINNDSGIYVFWRVDENGIKWCYCGQAKHLLERVASHLSEYDHIGLSLKKRKFYSAENPYGWHLTFQNCTEDMLDESEQATIRAYATNGYQLYNLTAGGQGKGKQGFDGKKSGKGYYDGLEQGKKKSRELIADLFSKHLDVSTKKQPPTKLQEKALQKFLEFISLDDC